MTRCGHTPTHADCRRVVKAAGTFDCRTECPLYEYAQELRADISDEIVADLNAALTTRANCDTVLDG